MDLLPTPQAAPKPEQPARLADALRALQAKEEWPPVTQAIADAPTLLNYARNPTPMGMANVIGLAARIVGEQTSGTREGIEAGIMPGLPNPQNLRLTQVLKEGKPTLVYHGTGQAFEQFDPAKADPRALYGPGMYFSENPRLASSYAEKNFVPRTIQSFPGTDEGEQAAKALAEKLGADYGHKGGLFTGGAPKTWEVFRMEPSATRPANVRPAHLDITKPFDVDAAASHKAVEQIAAAKGWELQSAINRSGEPLDAYQRLLVTANDHGVDRAGVTKLLQAVGYDGITHMGGKITGGEPHRVWITFKPEQVINPFEYETQIRGQR